MVIRERLSILLLHTAAADDVTTNTCRDFQRTMSVAMVACEVCPEKSRSPQLCRPTVQRAKTYREAHKHKRWMDSQATEGQRGTPHYGNRHAQPKSHKDKSGCPARLVCVTWHGCDRCD